MLKKERKKTIVEEEQIDRIVMRSELKLKSS